LRSYHFYYYLQGFYRFKSTKYESNNQNECNHSISVKTVTTDVDLLDVGTYKQLCINADGSIIEMLRYITLYEYLIIGDLPTKSNINVHCSQ